MSEIPASTTRCRRCGEALGGDQRWCLSCGLAAGTTIVRAAGWRRPLTAAAALGAIALVAIALAFVLLTRNDNAVPPTAAPAAAPAETTSPPATAAP